MGGGGGGGRGGKIAPFGGEKRTPLELNSAIKHHTFEVKPSNLAALPYPLPNVKGLASETRATTCDQVNKFVFRKMSFTKLFSVATDSQVAMIDI